MILIGHPQAAHQVSLANIQRRDPLDDLLVLLRSGEHLASSHRGRTAARRSQGRIWRNLILVLEATLNSPQAGSQRPDLETTSAIKQWTASAGSSHPNFPPRSDVSAGNLVA
jgi:hypothetical protein